MIQPKAGSPVRRRSWSEPVITKEADQQDRPENLERIAEEREARLEQLAQRESTVKKPWRDSEPLC